MFIYLFLMLKVMSKKKERALKSFPSTMTMMLRQLLNGQRTRLVINKIIQCAHLSIGYTFFLKAGQTDNQSRSFVIETIQFFFFNVRFNCTCVYRKIQLIVVKVKYTTFGMSYTLKYHIFNHTYHIVKCLRTFFL